MNVGGIGHILSRRTVRMVRVQRATAEDAGN
jgi:hypothetical protein